MTLAGDIGHVVIIVKENHAFDNHFGTFKGANGILLLRSSNPAPHDPDQRHPSSLTRKTTAVNAQFAGLDILAYFAYAREFTLCSNYAIDENRTHQ
jgi:phospholipase C